jgi:hypothetical protein
MIQKEILESNLNLFVKRNQPRAKKNMHAKKCNPIKLFENFLLLFKCNALTWQVLNSSENQGVTEAVNQSWSKLVCSLWC